MYIYAKCGYDVYFINIYKLVSYFILNNILILLNYVTRLGLV